VEREEEEERASAADCCQAIHPSARAERWNRTMGEIMER
jgi:hypothetical protein